MQMRDALLNQRNFNAFIIDEADECILEQGAIMNPETGAFEGFWDMLEKKTILLTATINISLEDALVELTGHDR